MFNNSSLRIPFHLGKAGLSLSIKRGFSHALVFPCPCPTLHENYHFTYKSLHFFCLGIHLLRGRSGFFCGCSHLLNHLVHLGHCLVDLPYPLGLLIGSGRDLAYKLTDLLAQSCVGLHRLNHLIVQPGCFLDLFIGAFNKVGG